MRLFLLSAVLLLSACGPISSGVDGGPAADAGRDAGSTPMRLTGTGNAIAHQNGKFLVAGADLKAGSDSDFQLARFLADGQLDPSFGTSGKTTLSWPTSIDPVVADAGFVIEQKGDTAYAVQLQGDKIVVGGTVQSQGDMSGAFGLARYSADGVLDTTFGTGGRAQAKISLGGPAHSMAIRGDGKIYAAGFITRAMPGTNGANFGIARFSADGAFDSTFGGATGVEGDFGKNEDARGLAFQGLKVVVGGGDDFIVARYDDTGALDMTFGAAGIATSAGGFANNFVALGSGELLLSGSRRDGAAASWAIKLVRYTAQGQLDATFGTAGVVEAPFDTQQTATIVLGTMTDGRIVTAMQGLPLVVSVARFSATGVMEATFGTGGLRGLDVPLPILAGMFPPSANQGVIVNDRLVLTATDTSRNVNVLFRNSAL